MKIKLFLSLLLSFTFFSYAQTLNIHKYGNGEPDRYSLADIESITFTGTPCPGTPTVSYAGQTYNTVLIGDQCWLKENLNVGTMIQTADNQSDNSVLEKYCYDNNEANCYTYGGLYQWNEAMQYTTNEGAQGICPEGWHIPTLAEFETLKATVGDDANSLKAVGQGSSEGAGKNYSGFSMLLNGVRYYGGTQDGTSQQLGITGEIWSSTVGGLGANGLHVDNNTNIISIGGNYKNHGWAVRCIKN